MAVTFLILSDIHANLEALQAVLEDAANRYERIYCLGDVVGYGADPNAVTEWTRANVAAIVRGNHDKACTGLDSTEAYHEAAVASTEWTAKALTVENFDYLQRLPRGPLPISGAGYLFDLAHGSPLDEDAYLITPGDAGPLRAYLETHVTFIGHTHVQGGFLLARGGTRRVAPRGALDLHPDHFYLINPGSVGQPRDNDPRAAYALYTPETRTIEYRRVAYDVEAAARKIVDAGLPGVLAARLFEGV
jgi:predicted phosphodiesterase